MTNQKMRTKDALIIYPKDFTNALQTESLFEEMYFRVSQERQDHITETDINISDVVVFVGEDYLSYDEDTLQTILGWAIVNNTLIFGLGDANSLILEYMSIDYVKVEGHNLPNNQVHNILTMDGEEIFIPSKHVTLPLLDEFAYYNSKKEYESLVEVAALAPEQKISTKDKIKVWAEILVIKSIKYIGVYGAPELFFDYILEAGDNDISETTIQFIESLLTDLL